MFVYRSVDRSVVEERWHLKIALIVLLAAALRLVWSLLVDVIPLSDSHAYDVFARNLLEFQVFGWTGDHPFAFWPPGTSFLYAAIYWVLGINFFNIVVF